MGLSFRYFQKASSMYTNRCVIHLVLNLKKTRRGRRGGAHVCEMPALVSSIKQINEQV